MSIKILNELPEYIAKSGVDKKNVLSTLNKKYLVNKSFCSIKKSTND